IFSTDIRPPTLAVRSQGDNIRPAAPCFCGRNAFINSVPMDGHTENLSGRATSASRNPTRKNYQLLGTGLVILALVLLYAFFGSAGNLSSPQWPVYQRY